MFGQQLLCCAVLCCVNAKCLLGIMSHKWINVPKCLYDIWHVCYVDAVFHVVIVHKVHGHAYMVISLFVVCCRIFERKMVTWCSEILLDCLRTAILLFYVKLLVRNTLTEKYHWSLIRVGFMLHPYLPLSIFVVKFHMPQTSVSQLILLKSLHHKSSISSSPLLYLSVTCN